MTAVICCAVTNPMCLGDSVAGMNCAESLGSYGGWMTGPHIKCTERSKHAAWDGSGFTFTPYGSLAFRGLAYLTKIVLDISPPPLFRKRASASACQCVVVPCC